MNSSREPYYSDDDDIWGGDNSGPTPQHPDLFRSHSYREDDRPSSSTRSHRRLNGNGITNRLGDPRYPRTTFSDSSEADFDRESDDEDEEDLIPPKPASYAALLGLVSRFNRAILETRTADLTVRIVGELVDDGERWDFRDARPVKLEEDGARYFYFRLVVSRTVLKIASLVWRRMFEGGEGGFAEGVKGSAEGVEKNYEDERDHTTNALEDYDSTSPPVMQPFDTLKPLAGTHQIITLYDDHPIAIFAIMSLIHSQNQILPHDMSTLGVQAFAAAIDKYELYDSVASSAWTLLWSVAVARHPKLIDGTQLVLAWRLRTRDMFSLESRACIIDGFLNEDGELELPIDLDESDCGPLDEALDIYLDPIKAARLTLLQTLATTIYRFQQDCKRVESRSNDPAHLGHSYCANDSLACDEHNFHLLSNLVEMFGLDPSHISQFKGSAKDIWEEVVRLDGLLDPDGVCCAVIERVRRRVERILKDVQGIDLDDILERQRERERRRKAKLKGVEEGAVERGMKGFLI